MTNPPSTRLVLFSMVKNEYDIIEDFLDQALELFDVVYLLDHESRDGTWELLESVASRTPRLRLFRLHAESYPQSEVATWFCGGIFVRERPDWLFFLDCDEFLPFNRAADLRAALAAERDADLLEMAWQNIGPADWTAWKGMRNTSFMQVRRPSLYKKTAVRRSAWEKAGRELIVGQGYHSAHAANGSTLDATDALFTLLHAPLRSVEQAQQKLIIGKLAYWRDGRHQGSNGIGAHWSDMLESCLASPAVWFASLRTQLLNYGIPRSVWTPAEDGSFGALEHRFEYPRAFERSLPADRPGLTPILMLWVEVERMLRDSNSVSEGSDSTGGAYRVIDRHGRLLVERAASHDRSVSAQPYDSEAPKHDLELIRQFLCWMNSPPRAIISTATVRHLGAINAMIGLSRPQSVVALGVLEGDVLCAICDACLAHGSDADVVGIDWNESRPADARYETLAARVGRDYPFARVLQGDLHAFRQQVPDGAVDLLYINGRDPRARHQSLTTWATALSERGICIYDGRERPGDGHPVLPPWVDWALPYPSEMLELSGGLQILVVGAQPPAVRQFVTIWQRSAYLRELLQTSAALMASTFPARLAALNVEESTAPLHRTITDLTERLAAMERARRESERDQDEERRRLAAEREHVLLQCRNLLADCALERSTNDAFRKDLARRGEEAAQHAADRVQLVGERNRLDAEARRLAQVVTAIQTSSSWRITAPLRRAAIAGRRLIRWPH